MIDVSNAPVEPTVTVINPDGSELITTNNVTTVTWIRLEIKRNHLCGYKIKNASGGIFDIQPNGKLYDGDCRYPKDLTGDVYDRLLINLV